MAIATNATENGVEQQSTACSGRSLRSNQMRYIPDGGKKRTISMNFHNSDEKKEQKTAAKAAAAPKAKKRKGNTVKSLRDLQRPSDCH